jgi:hypothetical protein
MAPRLKRKKQSTPEIPQMPFDEALKRLWASPPQHRKAKSKSGKKNK